MSSLLFQLEREDIPLQGSIRLDGSKSISNRALIIQALCREKFTIDFLSASEDTVTMQKLLSSEDEVLDTGPAGTTFRFLTAFLAFQEGRKILTGSQRMKKRPIGALVDALRVLGASIEYLDEEGYPPLQIDSPSSSRGGGRVEVISGISSQFISALLMVAPSLPSGLEIQLKGPLVSRSYLEMTLALMNYFGVEYEWSGQVIKVPGQEYLPRSFAVEADWSAASYHYTNAALSKESDLELKGLFRNSLQGDAASVPLFKQLGIQSTWTDSGVHLSKKTETAQVFEHHFINCPDIAQTLAVACAGKGVPGIFSGLETLRIKETDRITALQNEFAKIGVSFIKMPEKFRKKREGEYYLLEGKATWLESPAFETYDDHRMAMAFAPLSMLNPVRIADPAVVGKSYPGFWQHLIDLGWTIKVNESSS